jgi:tetratricopeptide (TPR) repeat protein
MNPRASRSLHASVLALGALLPVALLHPQPSRAQDAEKEEKAKEVGSVSDAIRLRREERDRKRQGRSDEAESEQAPAAAARFPNAKREEPEAKASAKRSGQLKKMFDAYENDEAAATINVADAIIADADANAYEHAIAARMAGATLLNTDDARAMSYLKRAVDFNGLSNNEHYESMLLLGQLQLQQERYAEGLATIDRFLGETASQAPEHLVIKGNALYRLERYPEAAAILKQAVQGSPQPKADWLQLLMGVYFDMNQPAEAAKIAEELSAKNPADTSLQMNLASIYMQGGQADKAAAILEKLRAGGQLKTEKDYRNLYVLYLNAEGKEGEAAKIINEGLEKGFLKPDYQTYNALAQAYWFSEQAEAAIDAYHKAAPMAPDGEAYLNLARALSNEGRTAEAREAAKQALAKGVKKPEDASRIIGTK